ncbi:MAG: tetratricopeptide repeat protein [Polyangiaceae bacterium]|nr:tetratricopeptide repeat protein [Polyangiaceae bacterium]
MSSPLRQGLLSAVALAVLTFSPIDARAQGFNPMLAQQQADAKARLEEGKAAAAEGRHADAVKLFKRADELDPKPETKFEMAKSLAADKKLIEASKLLNEILGATPAPPWSVKNPAQKMLTEVEQKIPWIQIKVIGPDQSLTSTTIAGKEVDAESEIPWNPGEYVVAGDADGYKPAEQKITLEEGEHEVVELELERLGGPRKKPPPAAPTATAPAPDTTGPDTVTKPPVTGGGGGGGDITSGPFFIPMVVGGGLGVVGIGVGTAFGIMALNSTASIEDCKKNVCPDTSRNRRAKEDALFQGNVSTIAFIAGGVGIAAGATMLVLQLTTSSKPPPPKTTGFVRPYVGAGEAGVFGTF